MVIKISEMNDQEENDQNNLTNNKKCLNWNTCSPFKTKLVNYKDALELISQKINQLNSLYTRKRSYSKLNNVKNISKCIYKLRLTDEVRNQVLVIRKLLLINMRSVQIMQNLYEENNDLQDVLNKSYQFIEKQSQQLKQLQENLITTEKIFTSQILKSKLSDQPETIPGIIQDLFSKHVKNKEFFKLKESSKFSTQEIALITNPSDRVQLVKKIIKINEELMNQYFLDITQGRIKLDIPRDDFKFSVRNFFNLPLRNFESVIKVYTQKKPEEKKLQLIEDLKTKVESPAIIINIPPKNEILRSNSIEYDSLAPDLNNTKKDVDINFIESQKNYQVTTDTQNPIKSSSLSKFEKSETELNFFPKESKFKEEKKTVEEIKKSKSFNVSSLKHVRENKVFPRFSSIKKKQIDFDTKSILKVGEDNYSSVHFKEIEKNLNNQEDIKKDQFSCCFSCINKTKTSSRLTCSKPLNSENDNGNFYARGNSNVTVSKSYLTTDKNDFISTEYFTAPKFSEQETKKYVRNLTSLQSLDSELSFTKRSLHYLEELTQSCKSSLARSSTKFVIKKKKKSSTKHSTIEPAYQKIKPKEKKRKSFHDFKKETQAIAGLPEMSGHQILLRNKISNGYTFEFITPQKPKVEMIITRNSHKRFYL